MRVPTLLFALLFAVIPSRPLFAQTPAEIDAIYTAIEPLYFDLHRNPELAFEEVQTTARLVDRLKPLGYEVTTGVGKTGIVALLRNGAGPVVMLRTELDALPVEEDSGLPFASTHPGVMHACGHDLHMSAWTGTATWMAAHRDQWHGTLMLVGQPAEEGARGASAMLQDGLFTRFPRPDFALSLHDDDSLPSGVIGFRPGPFRSMSDGVEITVYGRGGHAAMPMNTVDPIVLASKIVVALQTVVSRETNPTDPVVVTVGSIHGGTRGNVIPDEVKLQLSVRTYSVETRDKTLAAIQRITRGEAIAANAPREPTVTYKATPSNIVYNDPALTLRLAATLQAKLGKEAAVEMPPKMTSEDFAEYWFTGKVPSALLHVGAVDPVKLAEAKRTGIPVPAPHSPQWAPDREPTLKGAIRAEIVELLELLR